MDDLKWEWNGSNCFTPIPQKCSQHEMDHCCETYSRYVLEQVMSEAHKHDKYISCNVYVMLQAYTVLLKHNLPNNSKSSGFANFSHGIVHIRRQTIHKHIM